MRRKQVQRRPRSTPVITKMFVGFSLIVVTPLFVANLPASAGNEDWTITAGPNLTARDALDSVSCPQSGSCVTTGGDYTEETAMSPSGSYLETFSDGSWQIVDGALYTSLRAVSCWDSTGCELVGSEGPPNVPSTAYTESWDGSTLTNDPNPAASGSYLSGVSCTGSSMCAAVGAQGSDTLVESWNGSAWSIVTSPTPPSGGVLNGVSCASPDACTAVGWTPTGSSTYGALIETWNGSSWDEVPDPSLSNDVLSGVSCPSTSECTAVGQYLQPTRTLIENWDGSSWSVVPKTKHSGQLNGISCPSTSGCVAVGWVENRTLIDVFNGSTWTRTPSPNEGRRRNYLSDVSCRASAGCVAVGSYDEKVPNSQNLIESEGDG